MPWGGHGLRLACGCARTTPTLFGLNGFPLSPPQQCLWIGFQIRPNHMCCFNTFQHLSASRSHADSRSDPADDQHKRFDRLTADPARNVAAKGWAVLGSQQARSSQPSALCRKRIAKHEVATALLCKTGNKRSFPASNVIVWLHKQADSSCLQDKELAGMSVKRSSAVVR